MTAARVGFASRPLPGEVECGDQIGVFERAGVVTIALADGLGHGPVARTRAPFRGCSVPGVVGGRLRKVTVAQQRLVHGDWLVLCTDGISSRLDVDAVRALDPQAAAAEILRRYGKESDDAACVVARV